MPVRGGPHQHERFGEAVRGPAEHQIQGHRQEQLPAKQKCRGLRGHALARHDGDDMHRRAHFRDQAQHRSPSQVSQHPGAQRSVGCWRNPAGYGERRYAARCQRHQP
ncbi:MAG TPA: hypothetical protein VLQ80_13005 [Candidatus Saccharimonadia bacterium]|nr:hypothetical protein [Candidatus Saccharimonadia bacterium]